MTYIIICHVEHFLSRILPKNSLELQPFVIERLQGFKYLANRSLDEPVCGYVLAVAPECVETI